MGYSLRKLFRQTFEGHEGRPGFVGGSKKRKGGSGTSPLRPNEKQIRTALRLGVYQVSEGTYIPMENVKYSVELVPVKSLIASEIKKPSPELIDLYKKGKRIQPISVRKSLYEKKMKVLDGNHRLKAARMAGVDSVWVVAIEDW